MELRNELVRPSRNKHRSNAVTAMHLVDRRETVTQLEQQLTVARSELLQEETGSFERRKAIREMKEKLALEEFQSQQLFKANENIREYILLELENDISECRKLDDEQHLHLEQMQHLEADLTELTNRLEFLQNYQNTISDVEGFDRVVCKFQELNQTWQDTSGEYRAILTDAASTSFQCGHPTEVQMKKLVELNAEDSKQIVNISESTNLNKTARNAQWQISTLTESFKQHGHIYLAIINLAAHLSCHPIARTLMNIGDRKTLFKPGKSSKFPVNKRDEMERVPSVEQLLQPVQSYKERWRALAMAAISDGRGQVRGGTDVSLSSDFGRATDSVSIEIQHKLNNLGTAEDSGVAPLSQKQSSVNKTAEAKLSFIEQILFDLTLIKDEIDFQTDPIHYNEPGHSFA